MVEISKKKFKKVKRPSSASVIDSVEAEHNEQELRSEIELVMIDTEVQNEGINCVGIISLGKVEVLGSKVVIGQDGFISSLG